MLTPLAIDSILHASDFSPASQRAFAHALRLAVDCQAELLIAHVDPTDTDSSWLDYPGVRRTLAQWRVLPEHAREEDVARLGIAVEKLQLVGQDPVHELLAMLDEDPVDLAVLATHPRRGWQRWTRPETALPVARRSQTAALFVPENCAGFVSESDGQVQLARVLVPIDHAPNPQWAVSTAAGFLRTLGCRQATIDVVHVGQKLPQVRLPEVAGWEGRTSCVTGNVVEQLTKAAHDLRSDLVVLGTAGRAGLVDALLGSTSERLVHQLPCPVLTAPVAATG